MQDTIKLENAATLFGEGKRRRIDWHGLSYLTGVLAAALYGASLLL